MAETIAEDLGRLFEVGFNLGIYYHLSATQAPCPSLALHRRHLAALNTGILVKEFARRQGAHSAEDDDLLTRVATQYLWTGFLAGRDLIAEYLDVLQGPRGSRPLDIPYYQCSFVGQNVFAGSYDAADARAADEELAREHLHLLLPGRDDSDIDALGARYRGRGEFLQADTLLLVRADRGTRRESHHLLCVDLSVLSVPSLHYLRDIRHPREIMAQLALRLHQLRSRSVFSALSLDTGEETRKSILRQGFERYMRAFMREDRESIKVIQAASYASSLTDFLAERNLLPPEAELRCTAVGYTDRGVSALSARLGGTLPDDRELLAACRDIYKGYRARASETPGKDAHDQALQRERDDVLAVIRRNAQALFATDDAAEGARAFVEGLAEIEHAPPGDRVYHIAHTERLTAFTNSADAVPDALAEALHLPRGISLREGHSRLVHRALDGPKGFVFLTGNPGIGKTTALADYLREKARAGEGFLLLYASPRTQVNLDIFDKFREYGAFFDDGFIGLTSNAEIIKNNGGQFSVQYVANGASTPFVLDGVTFLDEETVKGAARTRRGSGVRRVADDTVTDREGNVRGVLASVCRGLGGLLRDGRYRSFAAAVSIQSYRRHADGTDTLENIRAIFKDACNREGPIPERMRALALRVPHIVVMIDEITGDDSGPALLHGLIAILRDLRLDDFGFKLTLVVADASIVGPDIIANHLKEAEPEPDKVFFRKSLASGDVVALSCEPFSFKGPSDAVVVNANSYPACALAVSYNVFVEPVDLTAVGQGRKGRPKRVDAPARDEAAERIVYDVGVFLDTTRTTDHQAIIYIQDKVRLQELIAAIRTREEQLAYPFREEQEYLQIHSQVSERDKATIQARKDAVRVVFMTSSASRGLSFKQARHIFVEVPRFNIEANLMEIMQVVYRGRGGDDRVERALTFYLADPAYYVQGDRQRSLAESLLHVLNMLMLLKLCLMTRIQGAGTIRGDRYTVVPVGGKAVSRAGSSLHFEMSSLLRQIDGEYHRKPWETSLRVIRDALAHTFQEMTAVMEPPAGTSTLLGILHDSTPRTLLRLLDRGCMALLADSPLEHGLVSGEMLIVPVQGSIAVAHVSRLGHVIGRWITEDVQAKIWAIIHNADAYPRGLVNGLRAFADIVQEFNAADRTQRLVKTDRRDDLYYAVPLLAYIVRDVVAGAWEDHDEAEDTIASLRDLLRGHVQALYPAQNILPIAGGYDAFPFIIFSSPDLRSMRQKMFTGRYMLMSHELNVLDMLLSQGEPAQSDDSWSNNSAT